MTIELSVDQPIAALASPPGGSLRGIIRISGNHVCDVLTGWFEPDDVASWTSAKFARLYQGRLRLADDGLAVEISAQVLFWPNRRSYTGQPLIELHLPGSPCLLEAVLGEAYRHGARPARPGEFTMRSFLAGKVDLLQAEAVLGVIDARNHLELQTALAQLAGGVSGKLGHLRRDLLELLADLEAGLDFVDEDIEFVSRCDVVERLATAREYVDNLLRQTHDRMQSRVRPKVVLAGLPNAGKSTLFNRLAGASTALVSPEQGTTRDFLTHTVQWGNLSFDLVDTAGWEDNSTGIVAAAQDQRIAQLQQSDLLVWCTSSVLNEAEQTLDNDLFDAARSKSSSTIRLTTKLDLGQRQISVRSIADGMDSRSDEFNDGARLCSNAQSNPLTPTPLPAKPGRGAKSTIAHGHLVTFSAVSAVTDVGLSDLRELLQRRLGADDGKRGQWLGMSAARCRDTLESVAAALDRAHTAASIREIGDELIAVDLRDALDHLGVILGVIYTDDILDRIFSKFCIGK